MIIGIGTDIVETQRIKSLLETKGDKFRNRVFTPLEQQKAEHTTRPENSYAKRFAAKEAFVKALQTHDDGMTWTEIEVITLPSGAPELKLTGNASEVLKSKHPHAKVFLSLSDTEAYAHAMVVISGENP